jgi:cobalt-zinc-cadmium efflux system protein
MPGGHPGDGFLAQIADDLAHEFSISHVTLQVETTDLDQCSLKPDDII